MPFSIHCYAVPLKADFPARREACRWATKLKRNGRTIKARAQLINKLIKKKIYGFEFGNMGRFHELKQFVMLGGFLLGIVFLTMCGIINIT